MDCTLVIHYVRHEFSEEALGKDNFNLAQQARQATFTAYSPYSHFCVGAAVLLDNGETVCGSNQENAAFGAGTCAERTALFYAHAHQPDVPVAAIAIAARKRPISAERVEKIVTSLQRKFESSGEAEITTEQIGQSVMEVLANLDNIAYIRFASVYKDFRTLQDLEDFVATIEKLTNHEDPKFIKEN